MLELVFLSAECVLLMGFVQKRVSVINSSSVGSSDARLLASSSPIGYHLAAIPVDHCPTDLT